MNLLETVAQEKKNLSEGYKADKLAERIRRAIAKELAGSVDDQIDPDSWPEQGRFSVYFEKSEYVVKVDPM